MHKISFCISFLLCIFSILPISGNEKFDDVFGVPTTPTLLESAVPKQLDLVAEYLITQYQLDPQIEGYHLTITRSNITNLSKIGESQLKSAFGKGISIHVIGPSKNTNPREQYVFFHSFANSLLFTYCKNLYIVMPRFVLGSIELLNDAVSRSTMMTTYSRKTYGKIQPLPIPPNAWHCTEYVSEYSGNIHILFTKKREKSAALNWVKNKENMP